MSRMSTRLSGSPFMTAAIATFASLSLLAGCASPTPDPEPSAPESEAEPGFDGVVGRDWVEIPTAAGALDGVTAIDYGLGALWALRDLDGSKALLTSTDAIRWEEVPLDPRRPADTSGVMAFYVDDERIVVAHNDNDRRAPWVAIGDGTDWRFISPDDIGGPVVTGDDPLQIRGIADIAPVGDSLLILMSVNWERPGGGTVPCSCTAPLVVHPDGSTEWIADEYGLLGTAKDAFAAHDLMPVDDGGLLITNGGRVEGPGTEFQVFHSANGLDWEDRTRPSIVLSSTDVQARVVRNADAWLTASTVREGDVTSPRRVVVLASDDGITWEPVFYSGDDEYDSSGRIGASAATGDGFFLLLSRPRFKATDVLYSTDTVEWTTYRDALQFDFSSTVASVVPVDGGLLALAVEVAITPEEPARLWVSGATAFTPESMTAGDDSDG